MPGYLRRPRCHAGKRRRLYPASCMLRSVQPLPPITFPGRPQRRRRDEALEAELQPAQAALEPGGQAARNVFALRRRIFFSAGVLFCIASHIPVETAQ